MHFQQKFLLLTHLWCVQSDKKKAQKLNWFLKNSLFILERWLGNAPPGVETKWLVTFNEYTIHPQPADVWSLQGVFYKYNSPNLKVIDFLMSKIFTPQSYYSQYEKFINPRRCQKFNHFCHPGEEFSPWCTMCYAPGLFNTTLRTFAFNGYLHCSKKMNSWD